MSASFDLDGAVVWITGASGALGAALVEAFDDAGASVCGSDVVQPADSHSLGRDAPVDFYRTDLTDEAAVAGTVADVVAEHGGIDHLVATTGTWLGKAPVGGTTADDFARLVAGNLETVFLATKHALPPLRRANGSLVTVASQSSLAGEPGEGVYGAAKAGVRLLTETVAAENAGEMRANTLLPSLIDTPENRRRRPDADHDAWPDPEDVARVALFLCSDGAAPVTGASVPVYGSYR